MASLEQKQALNAKLAEKHGAQGQGTTTAAKIPSHNTGAGHPHNHEQYRDKPQHFDPHHGHHHGHHGHHHGHHYGPQRRYGNGSFGYGNHGLGQILGQNPIADAALFKAAHMMGLKGPFGGVGQLSQYKASELLQENPRAFATLLKAAQSLGLDGPFGGVGQLLHGTGGMKRYGSFGSFGGFGSGGPVGTFHFNGLNGYGGGYSGGYGGWTSRNDVKIARSSDNANVEMARIQADAQKDAIKSQQNSALLTAGINMLGGFLGKFGVA